MRFESVETFRRWHCHTQSATDSIYRRPALIGLVSLHFDFPFVRGDKSNRSHLCVRRSRLRENRFLGRFRFEWICRVFCKLATTEGEETIFPGTEIGAWKWSRRTFKPLRRSGRRIQGAECGKRSAPVRSRPAIGGTETGLSCHTVWSTGFNRYDA